MNDRQHREEHWNGTCLQGTMKEAAVLVEVVRQNSSEEMQKNNIRDSNVVPHRSTNQALTCLTSLSRREAVLSCWYGRSQKLVGKK